MTLDFYGGRIAIVCIKQPYAALAGVGETVSFSCSTNLMCSDVYLREGELVGLHTGGEKLRKRKIEQMKFHHGWTLKGNLEKLSLRGLISLARFRFMTKSKTKYYDRVSGLYTSYTYYFDGVQFLEPVSTPVYWDIWRGGYSLTRKVRRQLEPDYIQLNIPGLEV